MRTNKTTKFLVDGFVNAYDNTFIELDSCTSLATAKSVCKKNSSRYERLTIWVESYDAFGELVSQQVIDYQFGKFSKPFKLL